MNPAGVLDVARKKRPIGRPKAEKPLKSIVSLKGTDDLEAWLDLAVDETRLGTRAQFLRNALREYAENHNVSQPMPKR